LNEDFLKESFNKYLAVRKPSQTPRRPTTGRAANNPASRLMKRHQSIKPSYVSTGKPRSYSINATNSLLEQKYKVSKGNTRTSHEDYGLFLRGLKREEGKQRKLKLKFEMESLKKQLMENREEDENKSVLQLNDVERLLLDKKIRNRSRTSNASESISSDKIWK
jgi:hypothetical protein